MFIYADNAATTRQTEKVTARMIETAEKYYGNPSSLHSAGQKAKEELERSRAVIAGYLNCEPKEIYFTSGGSESDNQAILSAAEEGARRGKRHIISTAFEHHAVLHALDKLKKKDLQYSCSMWAETETSLRNRLTEQ